MLDLNYTTFQGLCSAFIFKNVGLMALNILTVYALKLSTFLYQHFPYVFSVTTEEGSLFYEMPKSLHALRLIPSYLFRDCAPLIFSAKPQFLMTISMEFSNYGKKKKKKRYTKNLPGPKFQPVTSVSLHILLHPVSLSFKCLFSTLSLLDITCC